MMSHEQVQSMAQAVELRQMLDRLSRKIDYLYREMNVKYPDDDVPMYVIEAREYVLQGRDADAVKIVREHTAVGIIEARTIVEDLRRRLARSGVPMQEFNAFADVPNGQHTATASAW